MNMKEKFYIIDLPYAYFGITVKDSVVIKAPPIGRWMIEKNIPFIKEWVKKRGKINEIKMGRRNDQRI